jgi:hypothetical protein
MSNVLNIYSFIPQSHTVSSYYRIQVMAETARDLGLPVRVKIDTNIEGITPEERIRSFCEADMILLYQPIGDGTLNNVKMAKSFIPSMREQAWKYPPTFVLDTDDNLFRVDPHNPAFANLGVRDPDTGEEIPRGFSISEVEDGVRRLLWKDGAKLPDGSVPFDVERNRSAIETYVQIINHADCVTTTTTRCAEPIKEYATPRRVHVTPNLVRFDHYPQVALEQDTSQVKILWQGGQNHYGDWKPLKDKLGAITKKYPQVHWIMWGVDYSGINEVIPPHRMTFLPWCDYREYKPRRVMVGEDISLAPLSDTAFNRCRSAIKWYEASVSKRPAVTLAQATGPYLDEIQHGDTGMLFANPQEFEDHLSLLIENADERKRMAGNAKDWISENRDAMKEVPKLVAFYQQLREQVRTDTPHMPLPAWEKFEAEQIAAQKAQQEQPVAA